MRFAEDLLEVIILQEPGSELPLTEEQQPGSELFGETPCSAAGVPAKDLHACPSPPQGLCLTIHGWPRMTGE